MPLEELLAPASQAAIEECLEDSPGRSTDVRCVIQTVTEAYGGAVPYEDSSFLEVAYVADLPVPALRTWYENKDVDRGRRTA